MSIEIKCSKDYGLFHSYGPQRELIPNLVAKITRSMKKRGFSPTKPITVNKFMEIVDGQHRFQAAKNLGLPIYYMQDNDVTVDDVREMALAQAPWNIADYVSSQIRQGNECFARLAVLRDRSRCSWNTFLAGVFSDNNKAVIEDIKAGRFVLTETRTAMIEEFLAKFALFQDAFPQGFNHRQFVIACARMFGHPQYNHAQMTARMEYQSTKMVKCANVEQYIILLSDIYNYRSHAGNVVDFTRIRRAA